MRRRTLVRALATLALTALGCGGEVGDTAGPRIVSIKPAEGEAAGLSSALEVVFDEPVDPATVDGRSVRIDDVDGATLLSEDGRTATFVPHAALAPDRTYDARITRAVSDRAGNLLEAERRWSFRTRLESDAPPSGTLSSSGGRLESPSYRMRITVGPGGVAAGRAESPSYRTQVGATIAPVR